MRVNVLYLFWAYTSISLWFNGSTKHGHGHSHGEESSDPPRSKFLNIPHSTIPFIFGDIIHNFVDGFAIAGAFATSLPLGFGTSLAVLFHEIPHELGDFAIYLKMGCSKWQALGINFFSAVWCYLGLFIGLGISSVEGAQTWLLLIAAGSFFYIATMQIMPEMDLWVLVKAGPDGQRWKFNFWLRFCCASFGLVLGWLIMFIFAIYRYFHSTLTC